MKNMIKSLAIWYNCLRPKMFKEKVRKGLRNLFKSFKDFSLEREELCVIIAAELHRKAAENPRQESKMIVFIHLIITKYDSCPPIK